MELRRYFSGKPGLVLLGTAAVVVLGVAGNLKDSGGAPQDDSSVPSPLMSGFVNHQDPAGFSLQRPDDWRVTAPSLSEISIASPTGTSAALVRARVVRGDLVRYIAESFPGTEAGIREVQPLDATEAGPNAARALLQFRQGNMVKRASVVAVRQGEIATVFVAIAPAAEFSAELPRLTQILESFRFTPRGDAGRSPRAPTRPSMQFVRWVEPYEQAFSFEIPAGWQPQGGLLRRADGVRVVYQITAPDQAAFIFGGDQSVPAYFVFPTEIALSLGNREGYPTGPNGPIMLRFQDAASMGQRVIQGRFGQVQVVPCGSVPT